MKATVWMNEAEADRFRRFDRETSALREAYTVELVVGDELPDAPVLLERVYRAANRVDGSPVEQVPTGERSLSMGDVVVLGEGAWSVAAFGFEPVSAIAFVEAAERHARAQAGKAS